MCVSDLGHDSKAAHDNDVTSNELHNNWFV